MTLSQNGIDYICQNYGDDRECCVLTGLSWYYTVDETNYNETGGTAQIVSRLASGLVESVTMTNPARGTTTQTQLNNANGDTVTLEDAQMITNHDEPAEAQWCYGFVPPEEPFPLSWVVGGIIVGLVVVGVIYKIKRR